MIKYHRALIPLAFLNYSNITSYNVVVGANLAQTGKNPLYTAKIPSFLVTFIKASIIPVYKRTFFG